MTVCEYPCGCIARSDFAGVWKLVNICKEHSRPPTIDELLKQYRQQHSPQPGEQK